MTGARVLPATEGNADWQGASRETGAYFPASSCSCSDCGSPGVVDLTTLAMQPGMPSLRVLRRMILERSDFPLISAGKHGVPYRIDLERAVRFVRAVMRPTSPEFARQQAIRDLGLEMIAGGEGA